jgi:hypothetical protein
MSAIDLCSKENFFATFQAIFNYRRNLCVGKLSLSCLKQFLNVALIGAFGESIDITMFQGIRDDSEKYPLLS